jgi:hypothetical protein
MSAGAPKYDGLRPRNLIQAAQADLARRERNMEIAEKNWRVPYERYAFLKQHVRDGDGAAGILVLALKHAQGLAGKSRSDECWPKKRLTRIIYSDPGLIADALRLAERSV